MGRTATTGEFKDGSFKIKLTTSDKVSKYSVFFKDKKFELGKFTFNFSRETYSIPEKLVKFFNVTKTTDIYANLNYQILEKVRQCRTNLSQIHMF